MEYDYSEDLKKRISDNIISVKEAIDEATAFSGREKGSVTLIGVSKVFPVEYAEAAAMSGLADLGENRVQEFLGKRDELNLDGVEKHLIGHLQTNKVRQIVGEVDFIDGVDSVKVAKEIGKVSSRMGIKTDILLEINIGAEESKFGFTPESIGETVYEIAEIEGIKVRGLMAVPPICDNSLKNRQFFENMHRLFIDIGAKNIDNISMDILSMGMSGDYDEAILGGANMVRIGSALFGARNYR